MALNEDHGLTPEEEAALNIKDDEEEAHVDPDADPQAVAEPAADPQAAPAPAADADPAPAAEPAAAAADPAPEAAPAAEPVPPKVEAAQAAPLFVAQAPEDAQARLTQIAADKVALMDKFEAGEITTKEYQLGLDGLNDQQFDIKSALSKAEIAREMTEQQINAQWFADVAAFQKDHPEYADAANPRQALIDEIIKSFVHRPSMRNVSNQVALDTAHRMVLAQLGEVAPAAPAAKTLTQHQIPKPTAPPNIGNLPAAAMNDTTGGEFASLDALAKSGNVDAYEAAVENMTDAQRARYFKA